AYIPVSLSLEQIAEELKVIILTRWQEIRFRFCSILSLALSKKLGNCENSPSSLDLFINLPVNCNGETPTLRSSPCSNCCVPACPMWSRTSDPNLSRTPLFARLPAGQYGRLRSLGLTLRLVIDSTPWQTETNGSRLVTGGRGSMDSDGSVERQAFKEQLLAYHSRIAAASNKEPRMSLQLRRFNCRRRSSRALRAQRSSRSKGDLRLNFATALKRKIHVDG
uniref:POPLD domain-containing protein n=1 Tax=Macrostomum lignano TaxID=282301 RepID=A0A1I8FB92_9PLAT